MLDIDEKLVLVTEEAAEVIQAATKCIRFGYDIDHNIGYGNNRDMLSKEIGDLLGILDILDLNQDLVEEARKTKIAKVLSNKYNFRKNVVNA